MSNRKIGLLFRVSSKPQEIDGGGLEVQKRMGKIVSQKLGLEGVEFNEGVQSSYKVEITQRPKLVELLDEIQKPNGIRKVWVFNTDRLGRYSNSWYSILKVFMDYGVEIYIGDDLKPYDLSSSVDKLTISILSSISQYDNELRRMRSILGKRNSLKNGNTWVGGTIPFGYSVEGKKLVVNPIESQHVKKMFEMYDNGKSTMNIKVYLDRQPDINPRRSKVGWNVGTVLSMLRKEIYKGVQIWEWKEKLPNGEIEVVESFELKVPSIVDEKLWNSVQEKINNEYPLHFDGRSKKSLLKGLLVCPKCKLRLGHRFKSNNHYYGKCNEVNWRKVGDLIDSKNCPLKKSPRMEDLDEKVLDVVLNVIKDSKKIRENYKSKNLHPKFEEEKKIKTQRETIERKLRTKKSELSKVEEEEIKIEFDVRIGKLTEKQGVSLSQKFKEHIKNINDEIEELSGKLDVISNSKGWIDWLERMNRDLEKVRSYSLEKKREFLFDVIKEIQVQYNPKNQSHKLDIRFLLPLVGDEILYDIERDEKGFKTCQLKDGVSIYQTELDSNIPNNSKNQSYKDRLIKKVIFLREKEGLSFEKICEKLNSEGFKPMNGGNWYKSRISSFYNYNKDRLPK
ncbi:MAG: recombinase family protein [Cytophagia bacterium]|nr:recombinase family protein [Cytophagia bacterium]